MFDEVRVTVVEGQQYGLFRKGRAFATPCQPVRHSNSGVAGTREPFHLPRELCPSNAEGAIESRTRRTDVMVHQNREPDRELAAQRIPRSRSLARAAENTYLTAILEQLRRHGVRAGSSRQCIRRAEQRPDRKWQPREKRTHPALQGRIAAEARQRGEPAIFRMGTSDQEVAVAVPARVVAREIVCGLAIDMAYREVADIFISRAGT